MRELLKLIFSGQNQFASGGLLLMAVGSIGVFLRSLPTRLWAWIVGQCTMTVTVKDEDAAFRWVKEWFIEQPFLARSPCRSGYDTAGCAAGDDSGAGPSLVLVPGASDLGVLLPQRGEQRVHKAAKRIAHVRNCWA